MKSASEQPKFSDLKNLSTLFQKITKQSMKGLCRFGVTALALTLVCTVIPISKIDVAEANASLPTTTGQLLSRYNVVAHQGTDFGALQSFLQET